MASFASMIFPGTVAAEEFLNPAVDSVLDVADEDVGFEKLKTL